MVGEAQVSDSFDPLSGLIGPSLFPRTIRASANVPVPPDFKDLDSIHNVMKSLELRSPEKLMNEAKRIVDGGTQLFESNFSSFAEYVGITDAIAAKGKDRPQDRRPGLGVARKRAPFSLKTSVSQPSVSLGPTLNPDHLQDPDEFFDAYERMQNAKKEIDKQLGGSTDNLNLYKPSNNARQRRAGILGKSYNYKHRYSSTPSQNDDIWMSSQETVDQDIPSVPNDESQEKLVGLDPNPDAGLEEVELAESSKKTENEVSDMLEELLSRNDEDLEEQGVLNLLQERLKIKPLDLENLYTNELPDAGTTSISTMSSLHKPRRNSLIIGSALKTQSRKLHVEHEAVANIVKHVSSPKPLSPFASMSLLKKRILQSNPLRDPFSPLNIDISECPNASPVLPKAKPFGQIAAPEDSGKSSELESHVEVGYRDPTTSNMDAQEVMENTHEIMEIAQEVMQKAQSLPEQFSDGNASEQSKDAGQVDALADSGKFSELESHVEVGYKKPTTSNMDVQEVMENEHEIMENAQEVMQKAQSLPEHFSDGNASVQSIDAGRLNEDLDNSVEKIMNVNENESNPPVLVDKARDDTSSRQQSDPEQHPKEHQPKRQRGKRVACEERTRKAHPMRKSLAESGTSFETGVRRSKRIKMRPLEYWKGERFLYGRVDDSLKLIGVKYISPGKSNENLKVKPYVLSESSDYKEILELAARH